MKSLLSLPFFCLALPAVAQTNYSALIGDQGLSGAEAALSALTDPTASDRFALGGVLFLGAVERALQTRWQTGLSDGLAMMSDFPLLRLPIPENPAPDPFDPATVETLFRTMADDLSRAVDTLAPITDTDAVAVTIATADLWFDINMNAIRDPGEDWSDVAGLALGGGLVAVGDDDVEELLAGAGVGLVADGGFAELEFLEGLPEGGGVGLLGLVEA